MFEKGKADPNYSLERHVEQCRIRKDNDNGTQTKNGWYIGIYSDYKYPATTIWTPTELLLETPKFISNSCNK